MLRSWYILSKKDSNICETVILNISWIFFQNLLRPQFLIPTEIMTHFPNKFVLLYIFYFVANIVMMLLMGFFLVYNMDYGTRQAYFSDEYDIYCRHYIVKISALLFLSLVFSHFSVFLLFCHCFWLMSWRFKFIFYQYLRIFSRIYGVWQSFID